MLPIYVLGSQLLPNAGVFQGLLPFLIESSLESLFNIAFPLHWTGARPHFGYRAYLLPGVLLIDSTWRVSEGCLEGIYGMSEW